MASYRASLTPDFAQRMAYEITLKRIRVLRIHASGDFYDAAYIRNWITILDGCPNTEFYAYTRSWRVPELLDPLIGLAQMPNMRMWWSTDPEIHMFGERPPRLPHTRVAWMQVNDEDQVPQYVNVVFRTEKLRKTVLITAGGKLVCPVENGLEMHTTCSECGVCYNQRAAHRAIRLQLRAGRNRVLAALANT